MRTVLSSLPTLKTESQFLGPLWNEMECLFDSYSGNKNPIFATVLFLALCFPAVKYANCSCILNFFEYFCQFLEFRLQLVIFWTCQELDKLRLGLGLFLYQIVRTVLPSLLALKESGFNHLQISVHIRTYDVQTHCYGSPMSHTSLIWDRWAKRVGI